MKKSPPRSRLNSGSNTRRNCPHRRSRLFVAPFFFLYICMYRFKSVVRSLSEEGAQNSKHIWTEMNCLGCRVQHFLNVVYLASSDIWFKKKGIFSDKIFARARFRPLAQRRQRSFLFTLWTQKSAPENRQRDRESSVQIRFQKGAKVLKTFIFLLDFFFRPVKGRVGSEEEEEEG